MLKIIIVGRRGLFNNSFFLKLSSLNISFISFSPIFFTNFSSSKNTLIAWNIKPNRLATKVQNTKFKYFAKINSLDFIGNELIKYT